MEHLLEPFQSSLKNSVQAYQNFSQRLTTQDGAKAYVQTAFNPLFKKLKEMGAKIREHHAVALAPTTLQEKWQAYQQEAMPTNAHIQQMLRVGLSTLGLEDNEDFLAFVSRQQPQAWLHKRLKAYVWRFLILQIKEPSLAIHQWVDQLLALETQLAYDTNQLQLQRYKKILANKQHLAYIQQLIEATYQQLQEKALAPEAVEEALCDWFQANYQNVVFYPQDEIIATCFAGYFEFCLQQYLAKYRGEDSRLSALLNAFATLHTPEGLERFNQLFTLLKSEKETINPTEKEAIKSHCRHQLGDPRLSPADWLILKQRYNETYKTIQYWFNEADFELFFDFVFKDKPDLHGRKACWERYLPYAEDFKIFLPAHELQRFNDLKATGQLKTELEPWLNLSDLTSFVIKTDKVLIFETRETGNSAYIYGLTNLKEKTKAGRDVENFIQSVFFSQTHLPKEIKVKQLLAHGLIPNGSEYGYFNQERRHWRFTHDKHHKWHESVRVMMHQIHGLAPQNLTP
jgi:hypothetical protein